MIINIAGGAPLTGAIKKGTIAVTYPAGSECIVTKGDKEYHAIDTEGSAGFCVNAGTWTVTATKEDGSEVSRSISVENGKAYSVVLNFIAYLYNQGDLCEDITGGWVKLNGPPNTTFNNGNDKLTISITSTDVNGGNGRVGPSNAIDLTDMKKLMLSTYASSGAKMYFGVSSDKGSDYVKSVELNSGTADYELDVSELSGAHYISLQGRANTAFSGVEGAWPAVSTRFEISSMSYESM